MTSLIDQSPVDGWARLGTTRLSRGQRAKFRVQAGGSAVQGARISLADWSLELSNGDLLQAAVTGADGRAEFPFPLEIGQHDLRIQAEGFSVESGERYLHEGQEHRIDLTAASTWSGSVTTSGPSPEPIENLELIVTGADPEAANRMTRTSRTDRMGRFHVVLPPTVMSARVTAVRHGVAQDLGTFRRGGALHLTCVVHRIVLHVRSSTDSAVPVERFAVRVCSSASSAENSRWFRGVVLAGHHREGSVEMSVFPGEHLVQVVPLERQWLPPLPKVVHFSGDSDLRFDLRPAGEIILEVVTEKDEPISGAIADVLTTAAGARVSADTIARDIFAVSPRTQAEPVRWDSCVTDEGGFGNLRVPDAPIHVRVSATGFVDRIIDDARLTGSNRIYLSVELQQSGRVVGDVEADSLWPRERFGIVLRSPIDQTVFPQRTSRQGPVSVSDRLVFEIEQVPPGIWDVVWTVDGNPLRDPCGQVKVVAGAEARVKLDTKTSEWVTVGVRSVIRGIADVANCALVLFREEDGSIWDGAPRQFAGVTDAAGQCEVVLETGTYWAYLSRGEEVWAALASFVIQSETRRVDVEFAPLIVHLEVQGESGLPIRAAKIEAVEDGRSRIRHFAVTDEVGRAVMPVEMPTPWRVSIAGTNVLDHAVSPVAPGAPPTVIRVLGR
ncbi:MAG: carboxypeptidase-like regulatory domain-containing protein [Planctomycetota bacterium]